MKRTRKMTMRQIEYNARRCELAKDERCACRCGGALHGQTHTAQWISETFDEQDHGRPVQERPELQGDLFGYDDDAWTDEGIRR